MFGGRGNGRFFIATLGSRLTICNGKAHCPNNTVNGANELKWLTYYLFWIPEKN